MRMRIMQRTIRRIPYIVSALAILLLAGNFLYLVHPYWIRGTLKRDIPTTRQNSLVPRRYNAYVEVFEARRQHIQAACKADNRTIPANLSTSVITKRMKVEIKHSILYCSVEKVASTVWTKTLIFMEHYGRFQSPFKVKLDTMTKIQTYQTFSERSRDIHVDLFRKQAESLLVVRDPYTKLFSAYMDKLYHPNWLFWESIGEDIKKVIRKYKNPNSNVICGNDVTFKEFIKFIIKLYEDGEKGLNPHFTQIHEHCDPCTTHYTYISKLESFQEDYAYIMNRWSNKFKINLTNFNNFEKDAALDTAKTHIHISYSTMNDFAQKCNMPAYKFHQRTWRFLQISGLISINDKLPFPRDISGFLVSEEMYVTAVTNLIKAAKSQPDLKKQRQQAYLQAYRTVSHEDMMKLRKIVVPDCNYFGYDSMPHELFNVSSSDTFYDDEEFQYFKGAFD